MITARVEHALGVEGARERLTSLFDRKQIACEWNVDGRRANVSKSLPFVGEAQASLVLSDTAVEVEVVKAPPFPSAETIQRMIVDELARALA